MISILVQTLVVHSRSDFRPQWTIPKKNCIPKIVFPTCMGMKNPFPTFGNGNGRLVFPGMIVNGNSRSHLQSRDLLAGQLSIDWMLVGKIAQIRPLDANKTLGSKDYPQPRFAQAIYCRACFASISISLNLSLNNIMFKNTNFDCLSQPCDLLLLVLQTVRVQSC